MAWGRKLNCPRNMPRVLRFASAIESVKEPAKISNPEFSVKQIVARMKAAAARKNQFANSASSEVFTSAEFQPVRRAAGPIGEIDIRPITLQPAFRPHSDGRYHVNDLLKYHDRNFIQNAYRAILKRGPDATGYKNFLESLRSARLNKIDILARLRYSAEGRAKQVEIEGLRMPAMVRKAYRLPVIGYLLNLTVAVLRMPLTIRNVQQLEAHVLAQQEIIVEHLNHLGRSLSIHARETSAALANQGEAVQQSREQLEQHITQSRGLIDQTREQLEQSLGGLQRQQEKARQEVEGIARQVEIRLGELTNSVAARADELQSGLAHETAQRQQEFRTLGSQIGEATSQWREEFNALRGRFQQWAEGVRAVETELRQTNYSQREQSAIAVKNFERDVERLFRKQQEVSAELVLQGQRLTSVLQEARKRLPAPFDETQLAALAREEDHTLDAFYASFDEQFRGSRREIKERLKIYLPIIRQQGIGGEKLPLLDVGSGRGEWLELLREERLHARGVDSNRVLAGQCRDNGLEVVEEDLLVYLRQVADDSLGAVTGFHIVEHLPLEMLVEFLNETVRVLKPGGAVIFETPNPQNVLVGSCNFYFDPTHRNPLPSQVLKFLLESRGFMRVEVLDLNPSDDTPVADDSELARRFNQYFYGPMDYAVVGWKV